VIKKETLIINNKTFIKTYSDLNHYIKQLPTNIIYSEAIDVENAPYTYVETDEVIEDEIRS
jgi:hypothetical protein